MHDNIVPGLPEVTTVNNKGSFVISFFGSVVLLVYSVLSTLSCKVALIKRKQVDVSQI